MELVSQHRSYMALAVREAMRAPEHQDVPIGAIVLLGAKIIAKAHNQVEMLKDPTAHAEILAITAACAAVGSSRLTDCIMYVTHEPCIMCAGAILLARVDTLVFGAFEPKFGACGSVHNLLEDKRYNHQVTVFGGIMEEECKALMGGFFSGKR
jgi:tRNA(adenine34) deaminase